MPASSVRDLSRQWVELLAHYRRHRNDEHLDALVEESLRVVVEQVITIAPDVIYFPSVGMVTSSTWLSALRLAPLQVQERTEAVPQLARIAVEEVGQDA